MALETLSKEMGQYVHVDNESNVISFKIQNGPVGDNGVNGCQVDDLIRVARQMVDGLNKKVPCRENAIAITKLDEALLWLKARQIDRVARGVEGTGGL